jgi:hypothetical protein
MKSEKEKEGREQRRQERPAHTSETENSAADEDTADVTED